MSLVVVADLPMLGFWGNTDWLEARVRFILDDEEWMQWVLETAEKAMEA
jgi:hypothetical protein